MKSTPKVAIVGSGAAAFGALHGVFKCHPRAEVTLFDLAKGTHSIPVLKDQGPETVKSYYQSLYAQIKSEMGLRFPPVKTHLGESFDRITVNQTPRFFKSDLLGGMTNFWGATLLPFTDQDFQRWPVTQKEMSPYYKDMAQVIGIAGRSDGLNKYFSSDYITRPQFHLLPGVERLNNWVNSLDERASAYDIVAGMNRVALETRKDNDHSCTACGECMAGCYRDAIFSTKHSILSWTSDKKINFVQGRVREVTSRRELRVEKVDSSVEQVFSGFDRIFLGAGALGTSEIVMRSLGIQDGPILYDNAIFQFPIINLGASSAWSERDRYVSLSNVIIALQPPSESSLKGAQVQVYPNFDYLWRNAVPEFLWPLVRWPVKALRDRLLWGRAYLHSDHCYSYDLTLDKHRKIHVSERSGPDRLAIKPVLDSLSQAFKGSGFKLLPIKPIVSKTSSHLAGPFGYDSKLVSVSRTGEVLPGLHICDSAVFPDSPATSPTFTIMTNAYRTAIEVLS